MLIIYGSSRRNGNSEKLAKMMIDGLHVEEIYLRDQSITPITDMRHDAKGFTHMNDDYYEIVDKLMAHDDVFLVTPLYWYGMSALMKLFIDRWSESLRDRHLNFRENMTRKKIFVVVVGGDQPRLKGLPLIMQFRHIFEFFGATFAGYIIGEANAPDEIMQDHDAIHQAKEFNKKLRG